MEYKSGDRIEVESESTERPSRRGVVKQVFEGPSPRYLITWDDGHESIYTPSAGSLHAARAIEAE